MCVYRRRLSGLIGGCKKDVRKNGRKKARKDSENVMGL